MGFIKKIKIKNIVSYKSILASMLYKVSIIEYFKQQEFIFFPFGVQKIKHFSWWLR